MADSVADVQGREWLEFLDANLTGSRLLEEHSHLLKFVADAIPRVQIYQTFSLLMAALRLYEIDHGGLPTTLEALVPEYLDEVPPDPYNGEPLRYDPARRMVWSVGEDFVDSGGEPVESGGWRWRIEPTLVVP